MSDDDQLTEEELANAEWNPSPLDERNRAEIRLTVDMLEGIAKHAEEGFPEEVVGLMIGNTENGVTDVTEVRPLENTAPSNRRRRYAVNELEVMKIDRAAGEQGLTLLGFYHSHPNHPAAPSVTDLEQASTVFSYVIQSVTDGQAGEITSWRKTDDENAFYKEEIVKK
ncbi:MAG: M67 family metallopeptidase [Candidatus Lindowbacteria bacterium]|nr:M67 family metallopeptidase [Candidatus Lindowbacteria bacterium]